MNAPIATGQSDFALLREAGALYVDKTDFVSAILSTPTAVQLFCRPRRFGKTLNLSTLRYFLERTEEDRAPLFHGLSVWNDERARKEFARHPVIWLSFKDVKGKNWDEAWNQVRLLLRTEAERLRLLVEAVASPAEGGDLLRWCAGTGQPADCESFLKLLSALLHRATGTPAVILIDEYDTPIHSAAAHGYYNDAIDFFRQFYGTGLKDNRSLSRAVMTGILKVAKEGIFSGLNHVEVDDVLCDLPCPHFGFTEGEVDSLRERSGTETTLDEFRRWYNGYRIGEHTLYNPWSVLTSMSRDRHGPSPHWVATGGIVEVAHLIWRGDDDLVRDMQAWVRGETVSRRLTASITFQGGGVAEGAVAATLVHAGYLTPRSVDRSVRPPIWELAVPNRDVNEAFQQVAAVWIGGGTELQSDSEKLAHALLSGEQRAAQNLLNTVLMRTMSYHLAGGKEPEKVFHAFVAGLLARLDPTHLVWTEAEAGYGRADLLVAPRKAGGSGFVMELKRVDADEPEDSEDPDKIEAALLSAMAQIEDRNYVDRVLSMGASKVWRWALVWEGKRARLRVA